MVDLSITDDSLLSLFNSITDEAYEKIEYLHLDGMVLFEFFNVIENPITNRGLVGFMKILVTKPVYQLYELSLSSIPLLFHE